MYVFIKWALIQYKLLQVGRGKHDILVFRNTDQSLWVRKKSFYVRRWVDALVGVSHVAWLIFPFLSKMLSGKLQYLKELFQQIFFPLSYLQPDAAQYSGAQQETIKSPTIARRYREILSAKQAVEGFGGNLTHI